MSTTLRSDRRNLLVAAALAGVMALAAAGLAFAQAHDIVIHDLAYDPPALTVSAGDPVTWTNRDSTTHTVTSDAGTELDSGDIPVGEAYGHVFETPGVYAYHCTIHPDRMHGTIVVQAAPATASGPATPTPPAGTLPPNFSPFPSTGPIDSGTPGTPAPSPTPSSGPTPSTSGGTSLPPLGIAVLAASILAVVLAVVLLIARARLPH